MRCTVQRCAPLPVALSRARHSHYCFDFHNVEGVDITGTTSPVIHPRTDSKRAHAAGNSSNDDLNIATWLSSCIAQE